MGENLIRSIKLETCGLNTTKFSHSRFLLNHIFSVMSKHFYLESILDAKLVIGDKINLQPSITFLAKWVGRYGQT